VSCQAGAAPSTLWMKFTRSFIAARSCLAFWAQREPPGPHYENFSRATSTYGTWRESGSQRKNAKRGGELSEAAFLLKETVGFMVAKPWADSDRYDFILDSGSRLWRVQLKSTASKARRHAGTTSSPLQRGWQGEDDLHGGPDRRACAVQCLVRSAGGGTRDVRDSAILSRREGKSARWEGYREACHLLRTRCVFSVFL
jgi:hypothetical protein